MNYPIIDNIRKADVEQLASWYRFLPSPDTKTKEQLLSLIITRFKELGGMTPTISKSIGWN